MKTAVKDRRYRSKAAGSLLPGLGGRGLQAGIAALVIGDAAFLLDDLVGLLTHNWSGEGRVVPELARISQARGLP